MTVDHLVSDSNEVAHSSAEVAACHDAAAPLVGAVPLSFASNIGPVWT